MRGSPTKIHIAVNIGSHRHRHSYYGNPQHSSCCYANNTRRLKTLEILSNTAATQQPQQPQSPLTESTHPTSGMNQGLVSPCDGTSCRHTFCTIATVRVDTVDYKRRCTADPSSDGGRVHSSQLPQLSRRLAVVAAAVAIWKYGSAWD